MITTDKKVPTPTLRIVPIEHIHPHEEHDQQRSEPLLHTLRQSVYLTNPPIVAPLAEDSDEYVVLDGANRTYCFATLEYPHLLVQVVDYDSPFVELGVWNHVISAWDITAFIEKLAQIEHIQIQNGWNHHGVAQVLLQDGRALAITATHETVEERNHILRDVVRLYQREAKLSRTAITDPLIIWSMYPDAVALVVFPQYDPTDIIAAATHKAYLPPGVSRHIVQGRALKLNYPLAKLRDDQTNLADKNADLQAWMQFKLSNRAVRYYAESTYQFDE